MQRGWFSVSVVVLCARALAAEVPVKTRIIWESSTVATASELSLPCDVDGYPLPEVYWTKDGVKITSNDHVQVTDSRLTIPMAKATDSGLYGCHASNDYTSDFSTVQISVQGLYLPAHCTDNPFFANCKLIVQNKFCKHEYYSRFCCKSCVQSGQLNPYELSPQADQSWKKRK